MRLGTPVGLSLGIFASLATANAATIVIDDFEIDEGHFITAPSFSGTTTGETEVGGVGPSTADREEGVAYSGGASQRIFLDDDPNVDVPSTSPVQAWRLRHLSGSGTIANNLSLVASGYVGYFLKTTASDLQASIFIDDGATALERASFIPIIPDGQWHLYQWNLDDDTQWEPFASADTNGVIDSANVTIDGIYVNALKTTGEQDAIMNIDYVAANPTGMIDPIPEPSTALLLSALAAVGLSGRRRR